jgi:hypothetical protein
VVFTTCAGAPLLPDGPTGDELSRFQEGDLRLYDEVLQLVRKSLLGLGFKEPDAEGIFHPYTAKWHYDYHLAEKETVAGEMMALGFLQVPATIYQAPDPGSLERLERAIRIIWAKDEHVEAILILSPRGDHIASIILAMQKHLAVERIRVEPKQWSHVEEFRQEVDSVPWTDKPDPNTHATLSFLECGHYELHHAAEVFFMLEPIKREPRRR